MHTPLTVDNGVHWTICTTSTLNEKNQRLITCLIKLTSNFRRKEDGAGRVVLLLNCEWTGKKVGGAFESQLFSTLGRYFTPTSVALTLKWICETHRVKPVLTPFIFTNTRSYRVQFYSVHCWKNSGIVKTLWQCIFYTGKFAVQSEVHKIIS